MINLLRRWLQLGRDDQIDKAHEELAIAIIHSMWCGWLSQAKKNRGIYTQQYVDSFKQVIIKAFEIGQDYAAIKP